MKLFRTMDWKPLGIESRQCVYKEKIWTVHFSVERNLWSR